MIFTESPVPLDQWPISDIAMKVSTRPITFDNKLSAGMSLLMSLGLIGGGLWGRQVNAYERNNWVETQGTVVETHTYRPRRGTDETYSPVIEFEANGDRAQYIGPEKTFRWSKGTEVTIRYDPKTTACVVT